MLPWVCIVLDHRRHQYVVRTSVSLPQFDIIYDLLLNRRKTTWDLFVNQCLWKLNSNGCNNATRRTQFSDSVSWVPCVAFGMTSDLSSASAKWLYHICYLNILVENLSTMVSNKLSNWGCAIQICKGTYLCYGHHGNWILSMMLNTSCPHTHANVSRLEDKAQYSLVLVTLFYIQVHKMTQHLWH